MTSWKIPGNVTVNKDCCSRHDDVVIRRAKLYGPDKVNACWRCIEDEARNKLTEERAHASGQARRLEDADKELKRRLEETQAALADARREKEALLAALAKAQAQPSSAGPVKNVREDNSDPSQRSPSAAPGQDAGRPYKPQKPYAWLTVSRVGGSGPVPLPQGEDRQVKEKQRQGKSSGTTCDKSSRAEGSAECREMDSAKATLLHAGQVVAPASRVDEGIMALVDKACRFAGHKFPAKDEIMAVLESLGMSGCAPEDDEGCSGNLDISKLEAMERLVHAQMELEAALQRAVRDAFKLAETAPEMLIKATDLVNLFRVERERQAGCVSAAGCLWLTPSSSWLEKLQPTIQAAVESHALGVVYEGAFVDYNQAQTDPAELRMDRRLAAVRRTVGDFDWMLSNVAPILTLMSGEIIGDLVEPYDRIITPLLQDVANDSKQVSGIRGLLETKSLARRYQTLLASAAGCHSGAASSSTGERTDLHELEATCLACCLQRTRGQASTWFERTAAWHAAGIVMLSGRPFTRGPEDVFQIVHAQIGAVAAGGLVGAELCAYVVEVMEAVRDVMERCPQDGFSTLMKWIRSGTGGASVSGGRTRGKEELEDGDFPVRLAAVVNDYDRYMEKAQEVRDSLARTYGVRDLTKFDCVVQKIGGVRIRVMEQAMEALAVVIIRDSCSHLLDCSTSDLLLCPTDNSIAAKGLRILKRKLMHKARYKGGEPVGSAVMTLRESFADINMWLQTQYAQPLTKDCMQWLLTIHIVATLRLSDPVTSLDAARYALQGHIEVRAGHPGLGRVAHVVCGSVGKVTSCMQGFEALIRQFTTDTQEQQEYAALVVLIRSIREVISKGVDFSGTGGASYVIANLPAEWGAEALVRLDKLRGQHAPTSLRANSPTGAMPAASVAVKMSPLWRLPRDPLHGEKSVVDFLLASSRLM